MRLGEKCPNCGEEALEERDLPRYSRGVREKIKQCGSCNAKVNKETPLTPDDMKNCLVCGSDFMPKEIGKKFCGHCRENKVFTNVFAHNFGIIIPGETNVVYQHQTAGVRCQQVYIEGSFIPLSKPVKLGPSEDLKVRYRFGESKFKEDGDMLEALKRANRVTNDIDRSEAQKIWSDIREELSFDYETRKPPEGMPKTQEGLEWVKITDSGGKYSKIDEKLEGRTVAFIYPNSD